MKLAKKSRGAKIYLDGKKIGEAKSVEVNYIGVHGNGERFHVEGKTHYQGKIDSWESPLSITIEADMRFLYGFLKILKYTVPFWYPIQRFVFRWMRNNLYRLIRYRVLPDKEWKWAEKQKMGGI